ncbi:MAG: helicase HerA domain-containing protein, partial [Thermoplasmata archaeon]
AVLSAFDPAGASWLRHALLPAYEQGQWEPIAASSVSPSPPARRFATLAGAAALPLAGAEDRPPWSDTVLLGLSAVPPGVVLEWRGTPAGWHLPVGAPAARAREPPGDPVAGRPAPASTLERTVRDRAEERRQGLRWIVTATLRGREGIPEETIARIAGLVAAAARLDGGNGLSFHRPLPAIRRRAGAMHFGEAELRGLLPAPWCRAAPGPSGPEAPDRLPIGRGSDGRPTGLPLDPDQGRHLVILGETGMGKSSLLVRLVNRAARRGAVVVLDPIGDTGRRFLAGLDGELADRATWISPTDSPVGMNALAGLQTVPGRTGERSERTLHELVAALRRVRAQRYLDGGFWGPRIEEVLARTLAIAAALPGGTLVEGHALLAEEEDVPLEPPAALRPQVHALRAFARERPEEVAGSRRVLGEIARNQVLRRMLCEPSARFDAAAAVAPGAITVITADAPQVGESTARYLLSVHLALLWSELLARPRPWKIFLALEEVQWYAHESLLELLRLGRRGNVHVWAATQSLRSLGEDLREAVLTNTSDFVIFRGDPEEAREFARWSPELSVDRLLSLPRGQAAVLLGKGEQLLWTATAPLPPEGEGALH